MMRGGSGDNSDPYFDNVVFLSNYENDISDVRGHTVTAQGGAGVSGGNLVLDGSAKSLEVTTAVDLNIGDQDWTVDFFTSASYSTLTTGGIDSIIGRISAVNSGLNGAFVIWIHPSDGLQIWIARLDGVVAWRSMNSAAVPISITGTNDHWCVQRRGTSIEIGCNGSGLTKTNTESDSGAMRAWESIFRIGADIASNNNVFGDRIGAIRCTWGVCRFTAASGQTYSVPNTVFPEQ
jgi:hypothetical protein